MHPKADVCDMNFTAKTQFYTINNSNNKIFGLNSSTGNPFKK